MSVSIEESMVMFAVSVTDSVSSKLGNIVLKSIGAAFALPSVTNAIAAMCLINLPITTPSKSNCVCA
jgi:hypothetical protein